MIKTKALIMANLMPMSFKNKNPIKETFDIFKEYTEILLPSDKKLAKIKDIPKEELTAIRDRLRKLNAELKKNPKKGT